MIIVGLTVACIGIAIMIYYPVHKNRNNRRTAMVPGTCVYIDDEWIPSDDPTDNYSVRYYTFAYNVWGRQYTIRVSGIPGDPQLGQQVTLAYNPNDPQDAGYFYNDKGKEKPILYVGIGVFIFGVILIIL